jgi:hypothetical protein
MSVNRDVSIALYQSIKDDDAERIYECWHASAIAMCPRAHYFKRLGVPETQEPTSGAKLLRLRTGHLMEEVIRAHIKKVYGDTWSNGRYTSADFQLTGEFDNYVPAQRRLVEIKTVHDMAFIDEGGVTTLKEDTGERTKWGRPVYKPKLTPYLHHELQNHTYALLLAELNVGVRAIDYVYLSLSGRVVVYSTEVQEKLLDNVGKRLSALNAAWEQQEPPACICKPPHPLWDGVMAWCPYRQEGKPCCDLNLIKKEV